MGIDPGDYVHYRDLLKGERLPAAFVDLDRFDANVAYVASTQRATGKRIRVASKSLRCTALIRRIFARGGASYRGILGFTVEEAAFLAERGFDDLLVAYPTVQPSDLSLLSRLTASGKQDSLVVDAPAHLERLSAAGERAGGCHAERVPRSGPVVPPFPDLPPPGRPAQPDPDAGGGPRARARRPFAAGGAD